MKRFNTNYFVTIIFLAIELVVYYLILTTSGNLLTACCYSAIIFCFLFALINIRRYNPLILAGLAFTLAADFFLVVCSPIQQLWGMLCFLVTQTLYAVSLHEACKSRVILGIRFGLIAVAEIVAIVILQEKLDALAVVSVCYYANLIVNIIAAFANFRQNKLFAVALVLFLLCDTVIGLQAACGVYLPISEDSLIYKIIFMDFFLSWFFYLPSQVLIALSGSRSKKEDL